MAVIVPSDGRSGACTDKLQRHTPSKTGPSSPVMAVGVELRKTKCLCPALAGKQPKDVMLQEPQWSHTQHGRRRRNFEEPYERGAVCDQSDPYVPYVGMKTRYPPQHPDALTSCC